MIDVLIIGGGLTGLSLAYFLQDQNLRVEIIEARDRLGGRIHTIRNETSPPLEMGATWLGMKHTALVELLGDLKIDTFKQALGKRAIYEPMSISPPQLVQLPNNEDPSYRIVGGTACLTDALAEQLSPNQASLSEAVTSIAAMENHMQVKTSARTIESAIVISTLPPYLFAAAIELSPPLPGEISNLLHETHTWMGDSIKVSLTYPKPFWRAEDLSGTMFSNVGPIPEMYDHSDYQDHKFALTGFFNNAYHSSTTQERQELALTQLKKYYGEQANDFISYNEKIWPTDPNTYTAYISHLLPHQNNGHALFQQPQYGGKLFIGGAETAAQYPGYMDGAVRSAKFIARQIINQFQ